MTQEERGSLQIGDVLENKHGELFKIASFTEHEGKRHAVVDGRPPVQGLIIVDLIAWKLRK